MLQMHLNLNLEYLFVINQKKLIHRTTTTSIECWNLQGVVESRLEALTTGWGLESLEILIDKISMKVSNRRALPL